MSRAEKIWDFSKLKSWHYFFFQIKIFATSILFMRFLYMIFVVACVWNMYFLSFIQFFSFCMQIRNNFSFVFFFVFLTILSMRFTFDVQWRFRNFFSCARACCWNNCWNNWIRNDEYDKNLNALWYETTLKQNERFDVRYWKSTKRDRDFSNNQWKSKKIAIFMWFWRVLLKTNNWNECQIVNLNRYTHFRRIRIFFIEINRSNQMTKLKFFRFAKYNKIKILFRFSNFVIDNHEMITKFFCT